jgi:hypothetical protein
MESATTRPVPSLLNQNQIKSNQIFISPAATEVLYTVDIVLYIFSKHNVDGYKYKKFTDGGAARIGMKVSVCTWGPSEHILRGARWCLDYINNN